MKSNRITVHVTKMEGGRERGREREGGMERETEAVMRSLITVKELTMRAV